MGTVSFSASFMLLFILVWLSCLLYETAGDDNPVAARRDRAALEIIIGGGGPPEPECPPPPSPPPPLRFESERLKLVYPVIQAFKTKIKCDPKRYTDTWNGADICNYKGFVCDTVPTYKMKALAGADFNGANFDGDDLHLRGFIDKLPDLAIFHANSNNFTGLLPKGIVDLPFLYELDLSNNNFGGEFPWQVLTAKNLTFLDLRFNSLSGTVPPQVFDLNLDVLFINNNNFVQQLPDKFDSTTALYLTFANNKFTGPIPRSIGKARNLREILLLNNQLSGCLPYEIGYLGNATLFDAGSNKLMGPIPESFGCLAKIEILNLARNKLSGPVPEIVCKLKKLSNFSLSYNYFTEVGPECQKLIKKKILDVRKNCIPGQPNQRCEEECTAFLSKRTKPTYCDNGHSMKWVPCKTKGYWESGDQSMEMETAAAAPPLSYKTLIPHRL